MLIDLADATLRALYASLKTAARDVIRDYGARGDGASDDSVPLANALADAAAAGGGIVYLPPGIYLTGTLTLGTGVWLVGAGYQSAILKLKNGTNADLLQTSGFAALTGTNSTATPYNFGVMGVTLDGNKANNPSGGNCLSIYGYGYTLRDFRARNATAYGLWTEWGTQSSSPGNDSMEAFITDFKVHDCHGGGVYFKGPHDTQVHNGIIFNNGNGTGTYAIAIPTDQYGSGSVFSLIHVWGGNYDYAARILCSGITFADCQLEGSLVSEVYLGANNCNILDCKLFSLEPLMVSNAVKGIVFANSAVNAFIRAKMENIGGGILDLTSSGGDHNIDVFADYYTTGITVPSPAVIGSIDAQSRLNVHVLNSSGISTSDTTSIVPGALQNPAFMAAGAFAAGVGINTGPNGGIALAIATGADAHKGLVIFANSGSQSAVLLDLQNSSFADVLTVDASGNLVAAGSARLGGASTLYSGSGAPSNGSGANGDFYFREDTPGSANQRLYVKSAGAWTGIV